MTNEEIVVFKNVFVITIVFITIIGIMWISNNKIKKSLNESFKKLSFKKTAIRVVALLAIFNIFGVSNDPQNNEQETD